MAEKFRSQWLALGLEPKRFVRTTDAEHRAAVQHLWQTLYDKGEIELREYTGQYCVGCEEFKTERDLVEREVPAASRARARDAPRDELLLQEHTLLRLARGRARARTRA